MNRLVADTVIKNGKVITVNKNDDLAEAVAIRGNKILAVGTNDEINEFVGPDTKIIDAQWKTVAPGFIDAHMHVHMLGLLDNAIINTVYPKVKSIKDIQDLLRKACAEKKPGEWIKMSGYDHNKLVEGRHPTKEELDEVAPNNPVQCTRCCAHMGVYNTLGLKMAGIERAEDYKAGEVVLNSDGSLHGLLCDTAHFMASKEVKFSNEEMIFGTVHAGNILMANGVTSVHDAGYYNKTSARALLDACLSGQMKVRVNMMVFDLYGKASAEDFVDTYIKAGLHSGCGDEHFRIGPAKMMLDGSSSGPSSAVIEGYSHEPENHGILIWDQEDVDRIILKAHKAGFQVTAHAVGDMAVTQIVNAIEKALIDTPREDHRHRIEHCGLNSPELIARIKKLGIIPCINPAFIPINGRDYNKFYGERVDYMFPLKSYIDNGIIACAGSDASITFPNPMQTLYGAVTRKDINNNVETGPVQKVSILDAVRALTYNGAYAAFEENIKGSLEAGKLADVVILDQDLLTYPSENLMNVKVKYTLIDGETVYEA